MRPPRGRATPSIRARLLAALALLALATVAVGAISWMALDRTRARLDALHDGTLVEVAQALASSRRASDLATLAPFLLTIESPYRLRREAEAALALIAAMEADLPADAAAEASEILRSMREGITALVAATEAGDAARDRTLRINAALAVQERRFAALSAASEAVLEERQDWLTLQGMTAALLGAGRAENLIGVGEFQRAFHALSRRMAAQDGQARQDELSDLMVLAEGPEGLFELRRRELSHRIVAEAALARIRSAATAVNDRAAAGTAAAQGVIAAERARTTTSLAFAKTTILLAGLGAAAVGLLAALFISGYVTGNLRSISDAMMRLAAGDRGSRLPRGAGAGDEIGKLLHAFRAFRANALRLDRSSRQMARKNALFESMFAGISDGVAILSEAGLLVAWNDRLPAVLRVETAALGGRPSLVEVLDAAGWTAAPSVGGATDLSHPSGQIVERRDGALPAGGAVILLSDVTERRRVDDRLRELQRIESLGKVAGEAAHDFGNVLATISTSLHLMEGAAPDRVQAMHQAIGCAVDLGTSLTQRLLAFARRQHLEPEVLELDALVDGMADLVGLALPESVRLEIAPADRPLTVRVDPGQLESAILNLCLNAGQAMPGGGTITVTVSAPSETTAVIEVADTGTGMPPDILRHAMEPFFTARRDGTGTGLGLAMVYGFIRQSGGDVRIASVEGRGTSVRLTLPRCEAEPAPTADLGRSVLLVEDDPVEMRQARAALAPVSLHLAQASCLAEGLTRLGEQRFDLVVTDLHLANRPDGWLLAEAALLADPDVRVVVASGRLPAANPLESRFPDRIACLPKPVSAEALARLRDGMKRRAP